MRKNFQLEKKFESNWKSETRSSKLGFTLLELLNVKHQGVYKKGFTLLELLIVKHQGVYKKGFTLLELLIVIAILGLLAGTFMTMYPASQRRARDARRQSDIKQYQLALEKYANRNGGNFIVAGPINPQGQCATLGLGTTCPNDPTNTGSFVYRYFGTATQYVLWARLEAVTPATNFVTCSNGKSGNTTTTPTNSNCPI